MTKCQVDFPPVHSLLQLRLALAVPSYQQVRTEERRKQKMLPLTSQPIHQIHIRHAYLRYYACQQ